MNKNCTFLFVLVLLLLRSVSPAQSPYCLPEYTLGCANGDGLSSFQLGSIYQDIQCDGIPNLWYKFYTDTTNLTIGGTEQLTVNIINDSTRLFVWIDFNNNNQFDASEVVIDGMLCLPFFPNVATNLTIPINASAGLHRLRFRTELFSAGNAADACATYQKGNAGDFMVNLVNPSPPAAAQLSSPPDGAIGIIPNTNLNWAPGTGSTPAGYHLFLGTDDPPTNIVNGALVSIPYFNPYPDLSINTTYYWKVVPYNSGGQATAGPIWSFTTLVDYGSIQGFVTDFTGVPLSGASITASGPASFSAISDSVGHYLLTGVSPGSYTLTAQSAAYNTNTVSGILVTADTVTTHNLVMLQPNMTVMPDPLNVSLNPGEFSPGSFVLSNTGNGILNWTATISYNTPDTSWFSMPERSGSVNALGNHVISAIFDATGLPSGSDRHAWVTFTSIPNIGTVTVPVNMAVSGATLTPVTNVQAVITNPLTGAVNVSWDCTPSAGFLYYDIFRNSVHLANVLSETHYADMLPAYGTYTYCVEAVYSEGATTRLCADVEWPNPAMSWAPAALSSTVWSNASKTIPLQISNSGSGNLHFEFPAYMDHPGDSPMAYCTASASGQDEFISLVQLNTIHQSSGWSAYSDYTYISTDLIIGNASPITVTVGPPSYAGDITGVWIDYNHNNTFDPDEFTGLSGSALATGMIMIPATALSGPTTMRIRTQYNGTLSPCGVTAYGEVEDYTVNLHGPHFITQVSPASGIIPQGSSRLINVTFSASGSFALPGVYTTTLQLNSNDLTQSSVSIPATMYVGLGSHLSGVVTDLVTAAPLVAATVQVGTFSTMTNDTGYYSLYTNAGTYPVTFSKIGYQTQTISGIVLPDGGSVTLNAQLTEFPYPPACAFASVNMEDTQCTISWCPPTAPYEMLYDDGTAENAAAWILPGNMNAVKFTPQGYPATITGARFYIDAGYSVVLPGSTLKAVVYDADVAGLPGILLDSTTIALNAPGWVDVNGLNATLSTGDFFIAMVQTMPSPNCPYLGVDETLPTAYKSYSRNISNGGAWAVSPYQDFMIRAIVSSPHSGDDDAMKTDKHSVVTMQVSGMLSQHTPVVSQGIDEMKAMVKSPEGINNINVVSKYSLTRCFLGETFPGNPTTSISTLINNAFTVTYYDDGGNAWLSLQRGWYNYGIKALYPDGEESVYTYTNPVPHRLFSDLSITAHLECQAAPASGAVVTLTGLNYPYDHLTDTLNESGTLILSNLIEGQYTLSILYPGYHAYSTSVSVLSDTAVVATLLQMVEPARNLFISDVTLLTTWDEPLSVLVSESFEGGIYPPAGWLTSSQGSPGWYFTTNGGSAAFPVTPYTTYAVVNDEAAGVANNGCCDYLISPEINLTGAPYYMLSFSSFYNGNNGQQAHVEMSTDGGTTWAAIYTCLPGSAWQQVDIDLSAYSGATGLQAVKFAFHADDGGSQASGWAVDNIRIASGTLPVEGYRVMLNGIEAGQTTDLLWQFDPSAFSYGQAYSVCVAAIYCGSDSETICDTITSHYLCPPRNLQVDTIVTASSGTAVLSWNQPQAYCLPNLAGYHVFRDEILLTVMPYNDTTYTDAGLQPGNYCYTISAVYDLSPFGFPGSFGESVIEGPVCTNMQYGMGLPFVEGFSSGTFDTTVWNVGINWLIDSNSDNPVPAAKFKWDPLLLNYSSALQSNWLYSPTVINAMPYNIWFDYEVKLEDQAASESEKLTLEVGDGTVWASAKEYSNTGSFDWMQGHLNISALAAGHAFKVRFRANGSSSDAIHYWAVDNVHIFTEAFMLPPLNLSAETAGSAGDAIQLSWGVPMNTDSLIGYNVYRRAYTAFPPGPNSQSAGDWLKINPATVGTTGFLDSGLSNLVTNCFEYMVTSVYTLGESDPSNIAWRPIFVDTAPVKDDKTLLYPNPATNFVRIEMKREISSIQIYNALSVEISALNVKGQRSLLLNTSAYAPGIYNIRFTAPGGECFSRKLVVTR